MALFCEYGCRVRDRRGCPKHPMAQIERVLPLDGFVWFGEIEERPFDRGQTRQPFGLIEELAFKEEN